MNDRCVVVCPRREFIRPWIRSYFAAGNVIPLVIITGPDGDWNTWDMEYCKAAVEFCGGKILDCSLEWNAAKRLRSRSVRNNVGWYSKKCLIHAVASRLSPRSWAWFDDDVEITGDVSECFEYAESCPGFIVQQFYYKTTSDRQHPTRFYRSKIDKDDKVGWNSMIFFHGDANERLKDLDRDFPVEDDENIFAYLYKSDPLWNNGFWDCSEKEWQCICKLKKDIPVKWHGKVIHYTANHKDSEVKRYWASRAEDIPRAPFEPDVPIEKDPVDAVFVIGAGSRHNDEELRYALRSIDRNCKFIRDIYICGRCPDWVDRSRVKFLPWPDRFSHAKDANIIDKLRHACEYDGIAKKILFCSDDQFVTRPCTWDDFKPRYQRRYLADDEWYANIRSVWHSRLRATLERERMRREREGIDKDSVFYYEPHIWMPIDRDKFIEYAKWSGYDTRDDTIIGSGYYNFIEAKGVPNFDHCFISGDGNAQNVTHVSYNDSGYYNAISIAADLFPNTCLMEKYDNGARPKPPTPLGMSPIDVRPMFSRSGMGKMVGRELFDNIEYRSSLRKSKMWEYLCDDVLIAEEMRILSVTGWEKVWQDIIDRSSSVVGNEDSGVSIPNRSDEAREIIDNYKSGKLPATMRLIPIDVIREFVNNRWNFAEWRNLRLGLV